MKSSSAIVVVLLLVCAAPSACADRPLRIVTFNAEILAAPRTRASRLSRFRWDVARREHFERVAAIVETLNPDVLNLVEVTSAEGVELLIEILHEKGLTDFAGYHAESRDGFTGLDVALITRIKPDAIEGESIRNIYSLAGDPTWRERFTYTDDDGRERELETSIMRNSLYFITVGEHKLGFLGLHLKANPDDAYSNARRSAEARVARRIINQEILARGYTPIVLGDLNDYDPDVPDRDETRSTQTDVLRTLKDYDVNRPGAEMASVARLIPRQADRYTSHWDRNENGALDPYDVLTMLDHILLDRSLMPHVRRAHISHVSDLDTSDHWPVVVDLVLPEKKTAP